VGVTLFLFSWCHRTGQVLGFFRVLLLLISVHQITISSWLRVAESVRFQFLASVKATWPRSILDRFPIGFLLLPSFFWLGVGILHQSASLWLPYLGTVFLRSNHFSCLASLPKECASFCLCRAAGIQSSGHYFLQILVPSPVKRSDRVAIASFWGCLPNFTTAVTSCFIKGFSTLIFSVVCVVQFCKVCCRWKLVLPWATGSKGSSFLSPIALTQRFPEHARMAFTEMPVRT
jgi:hypothetical protein